MKSLFKKSTRRQHFAAWGTAVFLTASSHLLAQPLTVSGNLTVTGSTSVVDVSSTGNVTATGWGLFKQGVDFGTAGEAMLNWTPGGSTDGTVTFDITRAGGTYLWRDYASTVPTTTNKMVLDDNNVLSLYKSNGSAVGISFTPNTGRINISGTGSGIYSGSTPLLTVDSAGKLVASSFKMSDYTELREDLLQNSVNNSLEMTQGYIGEPEGPDADGLVTRATAFSAGEVYGDLGVAMSLGLTSGFSATAMSSGIAQGTYSTAMALGFASGYGSMAASSGNATGSESTALSRGNASGATSTALSGGNASGATSTALSSGRASGTHSMGAGLNANATSFSSTALGLYTNSWGSATTIVDTDPALLVGNGTNGSNLSNAIATLKNGQTTLTNRAWKQNVAANPTQTLVNPASSTDSEGNALIVEGHTIMKGKVVIETPQGDVPMFTGY